MRLKQSTEWGPEMNKQITAFISSIALALPMLVIYSSPASAEYSFQVVNPPGSLFTQAFGINNAGKVVGGADDGQALFRFTYNMKNGEYTTIIDEFSVLEISNSGVMVGDLNGVCAIRDKEGDITTFFPPSWTADSFCQARGVNPGGKVSGFEVDEFDGWLGFVYDPEYDTFEEFLPSVQTFAHGINAQGQIAGSVFLDADEAYAGSPAGRYGFVREIDGSVEYFAVAQSIPGQTRGRGISESGLITGFYRDPDTFESKSFVATLSGGTGFEEVTLADDQLVYQKPCDPNVLTPGPGYVLFTDVTASQIRNDGVVVGSCVDLYFNETTNDFIQYGRGFIATPIK